MAGAVSTKKIVAFATAQDGQSYRKLCRRNRDGFRVCMCNPQHMQARFYLVSIDDHRRDRRDLEYRAVLLRHRDHPHPDQLPTMELEYQAVDV